MQSRSASQWTALVLRWLARIWCMALMIVAVLEATGPSTITRPVPWHEWLSPVLLFAGATVGFFLSWRYLRAAGTVIIISYAAAVIIACFSRGTCLPLDTMALIALFFATPGVLFLLSWYFGRKSQTPTLGQLPT